jgi:hypothetical protein
VRSNLLDLFARAERFASASGELVGQGGYGFLSTPSSYHKYPDPIDTMLRLCPGNYWRDLRESRQIVLPLLRQIGRLSMPFHRPSSWHENCSHLSWLFRTYRVSIVPVRKPSRWK